MSSTQNTTLVGKVRFLAVGVALLLVAGGVAWRHVARSSPEPSFARGGSFVAAGSAGRPFPYGVSDAPPVTVVGEAVGGESATTTSAGSTASTTTKGSVASNGSVASKGATPSSAAGGSSPTTSTTAPGPAPAPTSASASPPSAPSAPGVHLPAEGTYRYTVTGDEAASGFGSRAYPAEMSASVHGGDGVAADETVLDLHFSDDHEERLVLAVEGSGLVARYEGGSITFGPGTQTSQADYRPPMLLVPTDSGQRPKGSVTKGSSEAHDGDSVSRVEDWTVTSLGTETIDVLGHPTETWVVKTERQSRPDSAEQVHRVRTAWYDPARGIWVRWTEKFDGYRTTFGVKFSYRSDYTATLAGVA